MEVALAVAGRDDGKEKVAVADGLGQDEHAVKRQ
jgi:hypothetical protein